MNEKILLEIKLPRNAEESPEAMMQFLASLTKLKIQEANLGFFKKETPISLEIALIDQTIHFYIFIPKIYQSFIESQLLSQYSKALIEPVLKDPYKDLVRLKTYQVGILRLQHNLLYPLRSFHDFKNLDPISSVVGMLSKLDQQDLVIIQLVLVYTTSSWQRKGQKAIEQRGANKEEDPLHLNTYLRLINEKISYPGFKVGIRIFTKSTNNNLIDQVAASFASFSNPNGNSLTFTKPWFWQKSSLKNTILKRSAQFISSNQIFNILEIATLYHYPTQALANIRNLSWTKTILSDPPENLPVAEGLTDEQKSQINFFASTDFKNHPTNFGILKNDRRRHIYIIGKTGTGKSTLIANMAISDIRNGEGVAVIDPHGDLSQILLDYIPSYRVNDVIFLDPADTDHPFRINPLEASDASQKELVASGIVSIFYKLYAHSWGPRLEYILRNCILTLLQIPDSTLMMVPQLLTEPKFRKKVVSKLQDPVLKNFWNNEFDAMTPQLMAEATSPILNKVGQFLSSKMIRGIIGSPKSTIDLEKIMNEGKILIINLAQGKIGEDNSALLGAMIITKIQLASMNRVNIAELDRKDFYLYVDEFQNFATTSFIKILSEARKYHLNLILANQYINQITENVRSAIFGNAGTIISFLIGAEDSPFLAREFGERFKQEDLLALGNFQMIIKMAINNLTSSPFLAQSLPLPQSITQNREKVIRISKERYSKPYKDQSSGQKIAVTPPFLNSREMLRRTIK